MPSYSKKISLFLLTVVILTATFFSGPTQASLWDTISAWVTINPLFVDVSAPLEVEINTAFTVEAKIINQGEEKIMNAKGEIFLPPGLVLLKEDKVQTMPGVIPSGKAKTISWSVKGVDTGVHIITVLASGELQGYVIYAEDSTTVEVKVSLMGAQSRGRLQNLFDFFRRWFKF